jgi:H+/Cl- antiporter ClcA
VSKGREGLRRAGNAAVFGAPFAGVVAGDAAGEHAAGEVSARRSEKLVAYAAAAGGAFVGLLLFGLVAGGAAGLPRLYRMAVSVADSPWGLVCLAAAGVLALVYTGAHASFARLSRCIGEHPIAKPLACGVVVGIFGVCLPLALFSGEEQIDFITASWQVVPAAVLVAAALAKAVLMPLCLEFGWRGGHFFPCIFMGVALGYGIATLTGADPVFCAGVTTAAFLACTMQRPLLAVALLLLCIPPQGLVWMALAALIGAKLPLPTWGSR